MAISVSALFDDKYITGTVMNKEAQHLETTLNWVSLPLTLLGAILNIIVIRLSIRLYRTSEDSTHLFVMSMSAADFLFTAIPYPYYILAYNFGIIEHYLHCAIIYSFIWLSCSCSGFSLTLLNIDKLIYFHWPLQYPQWMNRTRSILFICVCWTIGTTSMVCVHIFKWVQWFQDPGFELPTAPEHENITTYATSCIFNVNVTCIPCDNVKVDMNWYYVYVVCFCLVPVLSSFIVSVYLLQVVRMRRKASQTYRQYKLARNFSSHFQRSIKAFSFIFTTSAWTAFAYIPTRVFFLVKFTCGVNNIYAEMMLTRLLYMNPIINPVITLTVHACYRRECQKHMRYWKMWWREKSNVNSEFTEVPLNNIISPVMNPIHETKTYPA